MEIKDFLREKIQQTHHHPFLFIGSGFSHRYINTEKWDELLRYLCSKISNNTLQYNYYANKCSASDYYGQQPQIAEMLEKDFNEAAYINDNFTAFRHKHLTLLEHNVSPFKIAIAEHLKEIKLTINNSDELELLRKISIRSVAGIITTNYDMLLEHLFPSFKSYIGQDELLFSNPSEIGEIYKIHGSVENPSSIIISASDYKRFEEKSAYLIAKILTVFIEYPIIFIGYSINDKNIQNILETIAKCLSKDNVDILKERLIFINYAEGDSIDYRTFQFANNASIPMIQISTKNFLPIYQAIYEVKSTYNPTILRRLRQDIYNLALEETPKGNIVASGFEHLDKLTPDTNIILGVGVTGNGHLIKSEQLYEDIVRDNQYLNPTLVIKEYIPELLKRNSGGLPIYKYLVSYTQDVFESVKIQINKHNSVDSFLNDGLRKSKINYRDSLSEITVNEIIKIEGHDMAYKRLIFLEETDNIDLDELQKYLTEILGDNPTDVLRGNSELKRLIRIYDFLKYKIAPTQIDQ